MKIITIHAKNAIDFLSNNGIGVLTDFSSSPKVKESLNGKLYLEFEYISNGKYSKYLVDENIIVSPIGYGERQAFRIEKTKKVISDSNIYIYVFAKHISYDLDDNIIEDSFVQDKDADTALSWILSHTQYEHNFKGSSDIPKRNSARYIFKNPIQAILSDDENSFVNRWGGEIVRDNFNIKMLQARGKDKGVCIRQRKNLKGITFETDYSNIVTKIKPKGYDGLELPEPEKYIDSLLINNYVNPKIAEKEYSDIKLKKNAEDEEGFDTLEECYSELRKRAREEYENGIDKPIISASVDFIELSKTTQYEEYKNLEKLCIGDIVHIYIDEFDLEVTEKVISTEYDPISEKYTTFELGKTFSSYTLETKRFEKKLEEIIIPSYMDVAVQNATNLLTTALGGFIVKTRNELFILDNEDINKAEKVWRWNINGLGYSKTGINGPYETAMTQDGQIVANFITVGTMSVDRIEGLSNTLQEFSRIILEHDKLSMLVSNTIDITKEVEEENSSILKLENCIQGELLELHIYGNNTVFERVFPSNRLYPSKNLYPKGFGKISIYNNISEQIITENLKGYVSYGYIHSLDKMYGCVTFDDNYNTTINYIEAKPNTKYIISLNTNKLQDNENFTIGTYSADFKENLVNKELENITANTYYGNVSFDKDNSSFFKDKNITKIEILTSEEDKYIVIDCLSSRLKNISISTNYQEIELTQIKRGLRQFEDVCDELVLINNTLQIIRRIGVDNENNRYILENEVVENLRELQIELSEGTNYIEILNYVANMKAKYVVRNEFTSKFATTVELKSAITQLADSMNLTLSKKLNGEDIIAALNLAILKESDAEIPEEIEKSIIQMIANILEIDADNFKLFRDGTMIALAGKIAGWLITKYGLFSPEIQDELHGDHSPSGLVSGNVLISEDLNGITFFAGRYLGKDGKPAFYVTPTGKVYGKSFDIFDNDQNDKAYIKMYNPNSQVGSYMTSDTMSAYNIISGDGGVQGHCMHGRDGQNGHIYTVTWTQDAVNEPYYLAFWVDNSFVAFLENDTSDKRLKKDIEDIDEKLLSAIEEIQLKQFKLIDEETKKAGVIAQNVIYIFKKYGLDYKDYGVVYKRKKFANDRKLYYFVNYEQLLLLKTKCLENISQKQKKEIKILDDSVKMVKNENTLLKKQIDFLINKLNCEKEIEEYMKGDN